MYHHGAGERRGPGGHQQQRETDRRQKTQTQMDTDRQADTQGIVIFFQSYLHDAVVEVKSLYIMEIQ